MGHTKKHHNDLGIYLNTVFGDATVERFNFSSAELASASMNDGDLNMESEIMLRISGAKQ